MDYKLEDILAECKEILLTISQRSKKRERHFLDKRNYLISLLYFKFHLLETEISDLLKMNRMTIHAAKWQAPQLIKLHDISFMANANEFIIKYPFDFPEKKTIKETRKKSRVSVILHYNIYSKLVNYAKIKDSRIDVVAGELLTKALKIWDE